MRKENNSLIREFSRYVSLNVMGMIGLSCYILADTFFIARRLGASGLTSLNLAISIYSVVNGLGLMIGVGGATRYAIYKAKGERETGSKVFTAAAFAGLLVGILLAVLGLFGSGLLAEILGARGEIKDMTGGYLRVILCFSPCFVMNNILIAFVRNDGSPDLSMGAMLAGSFSNILLDYIFLFPFNWGIAGAAFATGLAPVISMGILSVHFLKKRNGFKLIMVEKNNIFGRIGDICGLGIYALINELSSAVVLITFNLLILNLAGNTGVAAYGIVANLALVAVSVFTGISQGSQPLISRCYGAGKKEDARRVLKFAVIVSVCIGGMFTAAAFLFTDPLVAIFNGEKNQELADIASRGLRLYFPGFCAAGVNIAAAAYLGAMEKGKQSFLLAFTRGFAAILVFAFLLSFLWGMDGIWLSFPAAEIAALILSIVVCTRVGKSRY